MGVFKKSSDREFCTFEIRMIEVQRITICQPAVQIMNKKASNNIIHRLANTNEAILDQIYHKGGLHTRNMLVSYIFTH